jgi:hypothetical protein
MVMLCPSKKENIQSKILNLRKLPPACRSGKGPSGRKQHAHLLEVIRAENPGGTFKKSTRLRIKICGFVVGVKMPPEFASADEAVTKHYRGLRADVEGRVGDCRGRNHDTK